MKRWLLVLALFTPLVARAELSLEWEAPSTCPRPTQLELKGHGRAFVLLREKESSFVVTVLFFEPTAGMRRVEAASCEEAVRAAHLLLELGSQSTPAAPPSSPPAKVEQPVVPPPPRWRFAAGAGAAVDFGSLPLAEGRFALSFRLSRGVLAAVVDFRVGLPMALTPRVQAQRLIEGQLGGCGLFEFGRLTGGPCVALAGGRWQASTPTLLSEVTMLAAAAQLRGALKLVAGLELGLVTGLRFNILRPEPFNEAGVIFTTPLLASEFQLTIGWAW